MAKKKTERRRIAEQDVGGLAWAVKHEARILAVLIEANADRELVKYVLSDIEENAAQLQKHADTLVEEAA